MTGAIEDQEVESTAPRARGKKRLASCLFMALSLALLAPSQIAASDAQKWTDPTGQITIDLSAHGWVSDPLEGREGVVLVARDPNGSSTCRLSFRAANSPPISRADLNARIEQVERGAALQSMLSDSRFSLESRALVEVDGVSVLDVRGRWGPLATIDRRFGVYHAGEIKMYTFACNVAQNETGGASAIQAISESIRFPLEQQ